MKKKWCSNSNLTFKVCDFLVIRKMSFVNQKKATLLFKGFDLLLIFDEYSIG
jgi:hypothetical protein